MRIRARITTASNIHSDIATGFSHRSPLQREKLAGALFRASMQIPAGGGDAGVSKGGLHQMNRCPAIERMRSMGMPRPVRGHRQFQTGALGCPSHNPPDRRFGERASFLPRPKDRIFGPGLPTQFLQPLPDRIRQLNGAGFPSLAKDRDLAAFAGGLQIAPAQPGQFAAADAGRI
jgi:hypothetical protein